MDKYFQYSRSEMMEFIPKDVKKSLEVGCGIGNFSKLLKKEGVETWGIEPEINSYNISKKNIDHSINGCFDEITIRNLGYQKFDLVAFNDVLEHMEDPWNALVRARSLLNPNGVVVGSIPNFLYFHDFWKFVLSKDFKYESSGIFDKTHLRFFTLISIKRLLNETGFDIVKIKGIHPTDSKRFLFFNVISLNRFKEMKYLQFGFCAKPKS